MQHTKNSLDSARRSALLIWAAVAAASALVVSTASAGAWYDDFERGGLADWIIYDFNRGAGSWDEKGGFVVGEINRAGSNSLLQLKPRRPAGVNTDDWSNYTVKVKMRLESKPRNNQNTSFGLALYDRHDLNRYHYILFEYQQAEIITYIRIGNSAGRNTVPFNVEQGVWYDLTASIETFEDTERVTFQVNDHRLMGTHWNGQVNSGGVALVVSDGRVSFDDFVVEGDSIPDGGNGLPRSVSPAGLSTQLWAEIKRR
ncbi:MAG: hypothetical protein OXT69_14215 [Candidatus Poribacteria bacterium]|nr:hypothetical protein [Candidatus Poribacteria bacterium]